MQVLLTDEGDFIIVFCSGFSTLFDTPQMVFDISAIDVVCGNCKTQNTAANFPPPPAHPRIP